MTEPGCGFLSCAPAEVFSPERFATDEQLMVQSAEQFSVKEVMPLAARLDAQEEGLMPSLVRKAGELGFCGVDTAEQYGGLGQSKALATRILEFLSLDASFSVTIGVTSGISQLGLSLFGSEGLRRQYLPGLASGELIGAYALSEPNSGTDALGLTTRAERQGDTWVLDGTKMWISNARWADTFLVMAKVGGEAVSAFMVERGHPGVSISREEHKLGLKGSSTARLVLENAVIPGENLVHEVGKGHHVALNALNIGRLKLAAMSIGPARAAIHAAARYAQDRRQFGQPIGDFGLVRKKFADALAWFFGVESAIYRTCHAVDLAFAGSNGTPEGNRAAAEEFAVECSACKVLASEAEARIVDEMLQVFGGYGFTEEFPVARIYRDARVSRIYEGTNEINRAFIADRLRRRIDQGRCPGDVAGDSFLSELAGKALGLPTPHQAQLGALSDLLALSFAEQSARVRAKALGGLAKLAYERFRDWANQEGARAFQGVTGEPVQLPKASSGHVDELADAAYATLRPL
jgi:alkylation response protein AidB-like acyl-CoA dehydrogenase